MKKTLLYLFTAVGALFVFHNHSFAQVTEQAASVTWVVSSGPLSTPTPTGNINGSARSLSNLTSTSTTGGTSGYANLSQWEKIKDAAGSTVPSPYSNTAYIEYSVTSTGSKYLQINSVSLNALAGGTSNVRLVALYSLDGVNFSAFPSSGTYNSVTTAATEADPVVVLRDDSTPSESAITLNFSSLSINVDPSKTFTVRIYPYLSAAGTTKSFYTRNTIIAGKTKDTTLPLNFLSFTAKPDALGKTVNLNWATANEVNTKNFEIQKRTDATEFSTIGTLASKNTAGNHNYSFTDISATTGNSYYRILQFDNDGASKSSATASVAIKAGLQLSIYPNPVPDALNVNHAAASGNAIVSVLNMNGKVVAQKAATAGSTSSSVDVSSLAPGAYMLVLDGASVKFVKK